MQLFRRIPLGCMTVLCAFGQVRERPTPASPAMPLTDYIVAFTDSTTSAQRAAMVRRAGGEVGRDLRIVNALAVRVPNVNVLGALQRDLSVVSIRADLPVYATAKPGGGGSSSGQVVPEGVKRIGLPTGGSDGDGVTVAVLDTGVWRFRR